MNCATHPDIPAIAYCRTCGKPLCQACQRVSGNAVFCSEHSPAAAPPPPPPDGSAGGPAPYANPYSAPHPYPAPGIMAPDAGASPGLAFLLGWIPGVGAIYNGQYVKGLIHVIVLGVLISIVSSDSAGGFEPVFGMLIGVWVFYMAFEAYHTARRRQLGMAVDEFSSIVPMHRDRRSFPAGPIVLIAIGLLFLLNNLEILHFGQIIRYWPLGLIALGAFMLYERIGGSVRQIPPAAPEVQHER